MALGGHLLSSYHPGMYIQVLLKVPTSTHKSCEPENSNKYTRVHTIPVYPKASSQYTQDDTMHVHCGRKRTRG